MIKISFYKLNRLKFVHWASNIFVVDLTLKFRIIRMDKNHNLIYLYFFNIEIMKFMQLRIYLL
jgi:hypothetical protein